MPFGLQIHATKSHCRLMPLATNILPGIDERFTRLPAHQFLWRGPARQGAGVLWAGMPGVPGACSWARTW